MNQILIIKHLNAWVKGEANILNLTNDGFITPDWMPDKGMYCCYSCGNVNPIEAERCAKCNDEKFVLTAFMYEKLRIQRLAMEMRPPKAYIDFPFGEYDLKGKVVVNIKTGYEYKNATAAAKIFGISKNKMYQLLKDDNNPTNLRYKTQQ